MSKQEALQQAARARARRTPKPASAQRQAPALPVNTNALHLLTHPLLPRRGNGGVRVAVTQRLQAQYGNRAVQRFLRAAGPARARTAPSPALRPGICLPEGLVAGGGAAPYAAPAHAEEKVTAHLDAGETSPWGEIDGRLGSDVKPHVFVNNGKKGQGPVYWGGGNGGQGEQDVGSIDLVAPEYDGLEPPDKDQPAAAWVKPTTGTATVTRSYRGVTPGPAGATGGFYFTPKASVRADRHEELHVQSSKSLHDVYIKPLEARVAKHQGDKQALKFGKTKAEAIEALKAFLDWNASVTAFQTKDAEANQGGGSVDATDMAQADFVQNRGPKTIGGVNYANLIAMPGEPDPM